MVKALMERVDYMQDQMHNSRMMGIIRKKQMKILGENITLIETRMLNITLDTEKNQ